MHIEYPTNVSKYFGVYAYKYRWVWLKPKLHDLALSMGENKTLNLKDKTSLKRFAR
jgi:hypothetical protein